MGGQLLLMSIIAEPIEVASSPYDFSITFIDSQVISGLYCAEIFFWPIR